MQDGKALQAGTSHYLGTELRRGAGHPLSGRRGRTANFAHTTSWGVSTRLIGGVIMTHGDDDGLRVPPAHRAAADRDRADAARQARGCRAARLLRDAAGRTGQALRASASRCACCSTRSRALGQQALGLGAEGRADHHRDRPARHGRRQCGADPPRPAARRRQGDIDRSFAHGFSRSGVRRCWRRSRRTCSPRPRRGSTPTSART